MKKFVLTTFVSVLVLTLLNSCNNSDPEYGITHSDVYVTIDNGMYNLGMYFFLVNAVTSTAQVTHDAMPLTVNTNKDYGVNVVNAYERSYSLTSLNGTYSYRFVAEDEQVIQHQFTLDLKTEPGPFVEGEQYTDFSYSNTGGDHRLSFSLEDVENAEYCGFYFDAYPSDWYPAGKDYVYSAISSLNNNNMVATLPSNYFGTITEIRVYPFIATGKDGLLVMKLGKYKVLNTNDSSLGDGSSSITQ